MITRHLEISNFRNIGISTQDSEYNETAQTQNLLLNVRIESNESKDSAKDSTKADLKNGALVIIIGENNTGKSNVSRALSKFMFDNENIFESSDYPNFDGCEDFEPELSMVTIRGGGELYL